MIIDKNGKLFGKVSIIDILIVLIILVFTFIGTFFLLTNSEKEENEQVINIATENMEIIYTVKVTKKDAVFFETINEGNNVLSASMEPIGEIISCEVSPAKYITENVEKLTFEQTVAEDKFDALIKIKTTAAICYPDFIIDGESIKVGKELCIRTENNLLNGQITQIEYDKEKMGGFANDN